MMPMPATPRPAAPSSGRAAFLADVEKRILSALGIAVAATLVTSGLVFDWSGIGAVVLSAFLAAFAFAAYFGLAYFGLVLLGRTLARRETSEAADRAAALSERTGRSLGVTLSVPRQALLDAVNRAVAGIAEKVALLPDSATRGVAESLLDRQRQLAPEVEYSLRLAQYLEEQTRDVAVRAAPESQEKLARVAERITAMDTEASRVAALLADCEASLLATLSERDDSAIVDLVADYSARLDAHYAVVREVNDSLRVAGAATPEALVRAAEFSASG